MLTVNQQINPMHEDMIHDAAVDFYGTRLATCSSDRTIKLFSISGNNHNLIAELRGHEGAVWQLAWAHPYFGSIIASCSYDRKVFIWKETKPNNWEKIHEYVDHESSVNSISWAPKEFGLMLASASSDGAIAIISNSGEDGSWTHKKVSDAHKMGANAVSWSPALIPNLSIFNNESSNTQPTLVKRFASGGCDALVKIWKFDDDKDKFIEEHKLEGHQDWVRDVAWSPSIGLSKTMIASCSQDRRVIIWTHDGKENALWSLKLLNDFDDAIWHVSWSVMGNILAVSGGENKVSLWKENFNQEWIIINTIQNEGTF